jgi:hypothetical protein
MKIFVFGSNLAGRHGKGAALHARQHYGAEHGVGFGITGKAYAIPTKDFDLEVLPLEEINGAVILFRMYVEKHPELEFIITRIGCGLAGYSDEEIAPMFAWARKQSNCQLPKEWI